MNSEYQQGFSDGYERGLADANATRLTSLADAIRLTGRRKSLRGLHTGGRCYGYTNVKVEGGLRRVLNHEESVIVREIFSRVASGDSVHSVVKDLNTRRIKSPQGGIWSCPTICARQGGLLSRILYIGYVRYGYKSKSSGFKLVDREHVMSFHGDLVIIERDMWCATQERRFRTDLEQEYIRRREDLINRNMQPSGRAKGWETLFPWLAPWRSRNITTFTKQETRQWNKAKRSVKDVIEQLRQHRDASPSSDKKAECEIVSSSSEDFQHSWPILPQDASQMDVQMPSLMRGRNC